MTFFNDDDLYGRGISTLLASWEEYARSSPGAAVLRLDRVAVAVFPTEPERTLYNNALVGHCLRNAERAGAVEAINHAYGAAAIERYSVWVHESDDATRTELSARGYRLTESTRAMGMSLNDVTIDDPNLEYMPHRPAH